mgnify:CR=1 FL=1
MISNYALAKTPLSRMLMALLLVVQLLCVVSSAFAAEHSADDIHHQTSWSDTTTVIAAEQSTVTDAPFHAGCDHCSHCHAAHIGLFKTAAALPVIGNELAVSYLNHSPSSPKRSIYRPPIA